jgi:hypothetical protein
VREVETTAKMSQTIDISTLPLEQLQGIIKQMEEVG